MGAAERFMANKSRRTALFNAAAGMDWQQVVFNGGPPCFHLEDGRFCGRAERWAGHDGNPHKFVSLRDLLILVHSLGP